MPAAVAEDGIRFVSTRGPSLVGSGKSFTPLSRTHWANSRRALICSGRRLGAREAGRLQVLARVDGLLPRRAVRVHRRAVHHPVDGQLARRVRVRERADAVGAHALGELHRLRHERRPSRAAAAAAYRQVRGGRRDRALTAAAAATAARRGDRGDHGKGGQRPSSAPHASSRARGGVPGIPVGGGAPGSAGIPARRVRPAMRSTIASAAARPARGLVAAGLAQHDAGDRRPLAADPADGPEGEAAAGRVGRAGLDADEPVVPEQRVGVVHGAGDRQRRARRGDDAREHRQAHGPIDDAHLVGGGRHGRVVVAARVGVAGAGHAQRPRGGVHPGDEAIHRAGIPARQNRGDVVRRRQQQRLQRLPLGQLLARGDGHDRLPLSAATVGVGDIGVGERDRRAVLAEPQRVVTEHEIGRHHLRDAGDRSRVLVRAGLDLRLSRPDERGLAACRPHGARPALRRPATAVAARGVEGCAAVEDEDAGQPLPRAAAIAAIDDEQAGGAEPGIPADRRSCWLAVGHAAIQGSAVLPARMRFSIRRRYDARSYAWKRACADRRGRALHGGSHPRWAPPGSDRGRHRRRRRHRRWRC